MGISNLGFEGRIWVLFGPVPGLLIFYVSLLSKYSMKLKPAASIVSCILDAMFYVRRNITCTPSILRDTCMAIKLSDVTKHSIKITNYNLVDSKSLKYLCEMSVKSSESIHVSFYHRLLSHQVI